MIRALDFAALALLLAFTAAMALNPIDIQTHNGVLATPYAGTFSGNTARFVLDLYMLVRGPATLLRLLARSWLIWAILLVFLTSGLWSVDPARTAATTLDLALVILCATTLIDRLGATVLMRSLLLCGSAIILASCLAALSGSRFALMGAEHFGLWRGFFTHKNGFGAFAALILVLAVTLPLNLRPWQRRGIVALCCVALWRAGSVAAEIATAIALLAVVAYWALRRLDSFAGIVGTLIATLLAVLALALPAYIEPLLAMLGRNSTLSGRIDLWSAAWTLIQIRPLGAGYGTGGGPLALEWLQQVSGWAGARQAHNAYLAVALDLGWAGLFGYLALLAHLAGRLFVRPHHPLDRAAFAVLVLHCTLGMAEAGAGPYPTVTVFVLSCLLAASAERVPATKRSAMAEMV